MNTFIFGLSVAALGMLVVFGGLVILIVCINVISALSKEKKAKQALKPSAAAELPAQAAPAPAAPASDGIPAEVVAAITAAIASVWQGKTGFTVRHIKRVSNAPSWSRAGREEQIYSRM